jgi:ribonuclease BN (tRNA processing enzyme)
VKLTFLGTCAGTEPMPGRMHSSFVIERKGSLFWFDAGEGCSRTAHLLGIDALQTRAIFLTHRHIDHTGGLPLLVSTIRKLNDVAGQDPPPFTDKHVDLFCPEPNIWEATKFYLKDYKGGEILEHFEHKLPSDGVVFDEDGFRVIASRNYHLGEPEPGQPWPSFSYRIEADGKSVVYSGDIAAPEDVSPIVEGADLVLMETGHHTVEAIAEYMRDSVGSFGKLSYTHHGRAVLADPVGEFAKAQAILGADRAFLAEDEMSIDI